MLPHGMRGKTMKRRRVADDGTIVEFDIQAQDLGHEHGITFAVDADVEVGDEVTDTLPNGKTKTMRLREVQVHQSPFGGGGRLDHTAAKYDVVSGRAALRQPTPVSLPGLHPRISAASGSRIATHHYDDAVFNAFTAIEDRVKTLSGSTLSGKPLMANVFNEQSPALADRSWCCPLLLPGVRISSGLRTVSWWRSLVLLCGCYRATGSPG
jgi:hypothetical protein